MNIEEKIDQMWNKLSDKEKIELMKKKSGLKNPTTVIGWKRAPESVRNYLLLRFISYG